MDADEPVTDELQPHIERTAIGDSGEGYSMPGEPKCGFELPKFRGRERAAVFYDPDRLEHRRCLHRREAR
jgi:hypothetical protein